MSLGGGGKMGLVKVEEKCMVVECTHSEVAFEKRCSAAESGDNQEDM